jgi:hypothetical protein
LLFLLVSQPGPNCDADEYDGHNDPDNKIGHWEWTWFRHYLYESDKACDDYNDGQN